MTNRSDFEALLRRTCEMALDYIGSLPERHVGPRRDAAEIADRLRVSLPDEAVIRRAQAGGEAWMGGTTWQGMAAMRVSVSGWATDEGDIDRTVAAIEAAART